MTVGGFFFEIALTAIAVAVVGSVMVNVKDEDFMHYLISHVLMMVLGASLIICTCAIRGVILD